MNDVDEGDVGNERRQKSVPDDVGIRNADILHHQKRGGAHDGWRDLTVDG